MCHVNYRRAGGLFKQGARQKKVEMMISLSFQWSRNKYFVPGHTKYVIVEHRLDCTGEEIALRLDANTAGHARAVDLSMRSKK